MLRKPKIYEVGTLLSRKPLKGEGQVVSFPTENGIIIDRIRMKGRYPVEYHYVIQWDGGEKQKMRPKNLKGYLKAGHIEILSEG